MTVKDLREELAGLPDEMIVVMAKDGEGNGFSPLADVDGENKAYQADTTWSGEVGIKKLTPELIDDGGYSEDDVVEGQDCLVLWPTN